MQRKWRKWRSLCSAASEVKIVNKSPFSKVYKSGMAYTNLKPPMQISHYDTYFENPKFCADRLRGSPAIIAGVGMLFAAFLSEGLHFRGQSNTEFLRGKMKNEPFFSLNV